MRAGRARRILLVDDHVDIREGLARRLTQEGVGCCSEAGGRQEALEGVHRELPDLALVDVSPGTDEAPVLVAGLSGPNIPVLVCSMRGVWLRSAGPCGWRSRLHHQARSVAGPLAGGARPSTAGRS